MSGILRTQLSAPLQRMITRLKVMSGGRGTPDIDLTVKLVEDLGKFFVVTKADFADKDISGATNTFIVYFTVPAGKLWHVKHIFKGASAGGTTIRLSLPSAPTQNVPIGDGATTTVVHAGINWLLESGSTIALQGTGNVGDTGVRLMILYEEEDAY